MVFALLICIDAKTCVILQGVRKKIAGTEILVGRSTGLQRKWGQTYTGCFPKEDSSVAPTGPPGRKKRWLGDVHVLKLLFCNLNKPSVVSEPPPGRLFPGQPALAPALLCLLNKLPGPCLYTPPRRQSQLVILISAHLPLENGFPKQPPYA